VDFVETITPPVGTAPGDYSFVVNYYINGEFVDEQEVFVTVLAPVSPLTVATELYPGDCIEVTKSIYLPETAIDLVEPQVVVDGEMPIEVSFTPEQYEDIENGGWVTFEEAICVADDAATGVYEFTVQFLADGELVAEQDITITVFDEFDWIMMVYMSADNNLMEAAWDQLDSMGAADYYGPVRPVVLFDPGHSMGDSVVMEKTYNGMTEADDEGEVIPVKTGEANMGDPDTLVRFINWVKENYPAQNYALVMWDHGNGWRSCNFCQDWTDGDSLSVKELGEALAAVAPFVDGVGDYDRLQVVGFDACLMQMLEVDYQIRDYAEYIVGSEEVEPVPGWPYDWILNDLAGDPDMTAEELAALICNQYDAYYAQPRPALYAAGYEPGRIHRKYLDDDSGWETVSGYLGDAVLSLVEYAGQIYAGTMSPGAVYRYDGGSTWTQVGYFGSSYQVSALAVFNGDLYAGITAGEAAMLLRYNGSTWDEVWADISYAGIRSLYVWDVDNCLYMGEYNSDTIWRWDGVTDPEKVMDVGGSCIWDFESYDGNLYASAWLGYLYSSSDGVNWDVFSDYILADGQRNIWDIEALDGYLYAATDWTGSGPMQGRMYRFDSAAIDPSLPEIAFVTTDVLLPQFAGYLSMTTYGGDLYVGAGAEAGYYGYSGIGYVVKYDGTTPVKMPSGTYMGYGIQALQVGSEVLFPRATMSAKDATQIGALVDAVDGLATALMDAIGTYDEEIATARAEAETFGGLFTGSIDLYHFAELLHAALTDTAVGAAAAEVIFGVDDAVICNTAGSEHPNANGIAIYYPDVETGDIELLDGISGMVDGLPELEGALQLVFYESCYDTAVDFTSDTAWDEYLKRAPRLVEQGILGLYIDDVLLLAHVYEDPIVRLEWPTVAQDAAGFTLAKPVNVVVTPEGAIDIGIVAIAYSQADLDAAGILRTELIGIAQQIDRSWELEKLTMNLPTWLFDLASVGGILGDLDGFLGDAADGIMGVFDGLSALSDVVSEQCGLCVNYVGAVIAIPWLDLSNVAPDIYESLPGLPMVSSATVTPLAMVATNNAAQLNPLQYPQNLYQGWNLVSLPVIPLDGDVATILSGHGGLVEGVAGSVEVVWAYDAATGQWLRYIPGEPASSNLSVLEDGVGYWFKMTEDATMTVLGSNFLAGPNAPPEYDLVAGWNLIGYKGILPMPARDESYTYEYFDEYYWEYYYEEVYIPGYLESDKVGFNRLQGYNRVYDALYTPDFVYPNDGYWIYVVDPGSIPGLNDECWLEAVRYEYDDWFESTAAWMEFWIMRDAELGVRLAWNAAWYAAWVIAPSILDYGYGYWYY